MIMARYRRTMAIRPVNRIKHVVDTSGTLAAGATINNILISTVDAPVITSTAQVETASKVNGLYLKVEVASNDDAVIGAIPNVYMTINKNPANQIVLPAPNAVGASINKRFIIHQEMIMMENTGKGGLPRVLFNGVIAIPKGYRRNGPSDRLNCSILSPQLDIAFCIQAHYKEFR